MSYFMLPQKAMEVAIGDIGYIRSNCFIKLHNVRNDWALEILPITETVNFVEASGEVEINETENGVIRSVFVFCIVTLDLHKVDTTLSSLCISTLVAIIIRRKSKIKAGSGPSTSEKYALFFKNMVKGTMSFHQNLFWVSIRGLLSSSSLPLMPRVVSKRPLA